MALLLEHRDNGTLTTGTFSGGSVTLDVPGQLSPWTFDVSQAIQLARLSGGHARESRDWTLRVIGKDAT